MIKEVEDNEDLAQKWIKKIRYRLFKQNKNWLAIVCGDTGSGKSYSALAIADMIVPRGITVKRNVVFSPIQFLEKLNDGSLKRGDIIIFDEAGVGMSSREWYSVQNKLLGNVLQTFRNMNVGVIFTTPNLSFVDVQARKLFHNYFETAHIDFNDNLATLKIYDIQHNSRLDKTYYKAPIALINGIEYRCPFISVGKPRPYLIQEYERVKGEYTEALNKNALEELKESMIPNKKKQEVDFGAVKTQVLQNKDRYLKEYNQRRFIDHDLVRSDFSLTHDDARAIKKNIETELFKRNTQG